MKIKKYTEISPSFKIFTTISKLNRSIQHQLKEVNYLQAMIILAIYFEKNSEVQPKNLSETLDISKSLVSHNLSQLESLKFIKRVTMKQDARCFSLLLTPQGEVLARRLVSYFEQLQKRTELLFTEKGARELAQQIKKLADLH